MDRRESLSREYDLQELNVMLIRTLYFEQASIIAAVVCSLIVAGFLKGIIGVGMPVVALPLLSLFIDVKSAAMLLSMPLIFGNLPQALEGGKTGWCLVQLMPVILGMIPGLFLGVRVLLALDANVAEIIAGLVLMGVGGVTDHLLADAGRAGQRHAARAEAAASVSLGFTNRYHIRIFRRDSGRHCSDAGPACFHISACKGTARKGLHKGSIAVSRCFRRFAGNSSDGKPPVQLA